MTTINQLLQRLKKHSIILVNAGSLIGTLGVTSGLGFVYWWLAAKLFEPADVGLASALVSAMMLLATLGMVGMGTLLIGELSRRPKIVVSLTSTALLVTAIASAITGIVFALGAPAISDEFTLLNKNIFNLLFFTIGVVASGVLLVLDQALLGLLKGNVQLLRNAIFAASKVVVLVAVGVAYEYHVSGMVIYATWFVGNVLSTLPLLIYTRGIPLKEYRPQWGIFRELGTTAVAHHVLNLSLQTSQFAMPVIVTLMFSSEVNASFYVAWLLASFLFVVPTALTQTLYAVSSSDESILAQKIRFTLRLSFLAELAGVFVLIVVAGFLMSLFGEHYAETATTSLRILPFAAFAVIIRVHYVAIFQIQRRVKDAAQFFLVCAALELSLAVIGGMVGDLAGLSLGWVLALYLQAAMMLPTVYRTAVESRRPTFVTDLPATP